MCVMRVLFVHSALCASQVDAGLLQLLEALVILFVCVVCVMCVMFGRAAPSSITHNASKHIHTQHTPGPGGTYVQIEV